MIFRRIKLDPDLVLKLEELQSMLETKPSLDEMVNVMVWAQLFEYKGLGEKDE